MKLLLDTATFLWLTYDAEKLSPAARSAYGSRDNEVYLSVVSIWEIIVKNKIGKLPLPAPLEELISPLVQTRAATILQLSQSAVMRLQTLPNIHRDPFDQMLACQAADMGLTLVTPDAILATYPIDTLW